jgi:S-adenosylmethionine decarboxylase
MDERGRHVLADVYLERWPGDDAVMAACERAIGNSRMNVVAQTVKRFRPHGLTAVWILEESHFTLHTYPEHAYMSVDCYTCGAEGRPDLAIGSLLRSLPVARVGSHELSRGGGALERVSRGIRV